MKKILFLAATLIMSVGAWAQTLPIKSGVYEIQNVSGEGNGVGRGYLVDYTSWDKGPSIAECKWTTYENKHPKDRNSETTCSYWYLKHETNGTYTLFSLSTFGDRKTPKYLKVGTDDRQNKNCTWSEEKVELDIVASTRNNNSKEHAVNIKNHGGTRALSMACGTESSKGSVQSDTNFGDGGVVVYFSEPTDFQPTAEQKALLDAAGVEYVTDEDAFILNLNWTGYSTLFLDKNVKIPANVNVYYCPQEVANYYLNTQKVEGTVLKKGIAYIVEGKANTTHKFVYTNEAGAEVENVFGLWGCYHETNRAEMVNIMKEMEGVLDFSHFYVLSMVNGKLGFYRYEGEKLGANKAFYLHSTSIVEGTQGFELNFGGQTTGVDNVAATQQNAVNYDLQGRRVSKATRGLFIQNGVKVIR